VKNHQGDFYQKILISKSGVVSKSIHYQMEISILNSRFQNGNELLAKRIANKSITLPNYNKSRQIQRPIFYFYIKIKISGTTSNGLDKYYPGHR